MPAAYFIVLERKIDGLDTGMDGKSISEHMEALDEAARELGVRPLSEFFSADPEQVAEFMEGEGVDLGDTKFVSRWRSILPMQAAFSARESFGLFAAATDVSQPFCRFYLVRSPFAWRAAPFGLRDAFSRRAQLRSMCCDRFCIDCNAFALKTTPFRWREAFLHRSQRFSVAGNSFWSTGTIFAFWAIAATLSHRFCIDRNAFALRAARFGLRAEFLHRSQLQSLRCNRFRFVRSHSRARAPIFDARGRYPGGLRNERRE